MKLEEIGFYTLSDDRIKQVSPTSPMWRTELLVTEKCNFHCPYCRGTEKIKQDLTHFIYTIDCWAQTGLKNIRFSGGEPTLHPELDYLIRIAKEDGCEHVAISTNGSASLSLYKKLIVVGANDFSISLDACCASTGDMMAGNVRGAWKKVISNIKELSKLTYVTVGVVITNDNVKELVDIVKFAHSLGVADIRIISAAQLSGEMQASLINSAMEIPKEIRDAHPILRYRIHNLILGRNVRGIKEDDSHRCALVLDDSASLNGYHYPCIIYLREGGKPIGKISSGMRRERWEWFLTHDTHTDLICKNNCLDVCVDYNNKYKELRA